MAVDANLAEAAAALIAGRADVNRSSKVGALPAVHVLLSLGGAKNGWTPLMAAATYDDHSTAALLLEARANPDARDVVSGGTRKCRMKAPATSSCLSARQSGHTAADVARSQMASAVLAVLSGHGR